MARYLFSNGRKLYRREKFQRAVESFKAAFELMPNKNIVLNLAICYAEMESPLRSIRYLRQAERMGGRRADEILDSAEYAKLLALKQRVSILIVDPGDPNADVYVGENRVGRGRVEAVLHPASHRVVVRKGNTVLANQLVELHPGKERVVKLAELKRSSPRVRPPATPPPPPAKDASNKVRGVPMGVTITFMVLAAAAGGTLVYTGLRTKELADEYHQTGDPDVEQEGERYKLATNVLIGVTAGTATVAILLAIFTNWSRKKRETATTLAPLTGPGSAGLVLSGRF